MKAPKVTAAAAAPAPALSPRQKELAELDARRKKITDKSGPLRAELDKIVAELQPKEQKLRKQIREVEKDLYDIDVQRAALMR